MTYNIKELRVKRYNLMAKAKLNPMFTSINGRIGNIVFYKRKGIQCLRRYVIPHNPDTEAQRKNRHTFRNAVSSWKALSVEEKNTWNKKVRRLRKQMSGYNLYISEYMKENNINKLLTGTDLLSDRPCRDIYPLRPFNNPAPYMIKNSWYIAFTAVNDSP